MCHSWEDRERWEEMQAREADDERIRLLDEHLERRRDLVVHIRRLAPKALPEVTAAREH